ncbi:MAG: response regulator [bacterium]|nr:response regulator [bacterium]
MDTTKKKILIVDDDASITEIFTDKLVASGFSVLVARDGESGLSLALHEHPDLVFLDILMPKMDGLAVLKELKKDDWGQMVPIFMLTNIGETEKISEALNDKVTGYFIKGTTELDEIVGVARTTLGLAS